ncbi:hypothetical protein [Leptospira perdikensis]|uniref:Uncharacterized protein n=1 Tax=Leptospira perdikensis TaxID=2484948 RepID=A0A4R9JGB9_9LEPT|nr:hypothetical protein [Leptospira perdikensis]TGL41014.1 hypothetical protein EHQ49_09485 [Leptospira perdikensis]
MNQIKTIIFTISIFYFQCNKLDHTKVEGFKEVVFLNENIKKHTHIRLNINTSIYSNFGDKKEIDYCPKFTISKILDFSAFQYSTKSGTKHAEMVKVKCGVLTGWIYLIPFQYNLGNESELKEKITMIDNAEKFRSKMVGFYSLKYFRIKLDHGQNAIIAFADSNSVVSDIFPIYYEIKDNEWMLENKETKMVLKKDDYKFSFQVIKDETGKFNFLNDKVLDTFLLEL